MRTGKLMGTDCLSAAEMQFLASLFLGITACRPGQHRARSVTAEINHEIFNTEVEEKAENLGEQLLENWKSSVLKKRVGFTETEVTLGVRGAAGTDRLPPCLLHQRQRLLPGVKEELVQKYWDFPENKNYTCQPT